MTEGRLYKSARATGAMADDAILALPARPDENVPAGAWEAVEIAEPAVTSNPVPAQDDSGPALAPAADQVGAPLAGASAASRSAVSDFDYIFADDGVAVAEPDDLFPWESSAATSTPEPTSAAGKSAASVGGAPATPHASDLVSQVEANSSKSAIGAVPADKTPVVTYRSNHPRIRLTFIGALAAIVGVTVFFGLIEALVSNHIGMLTAILSVATAVAATWFVSESDKTTPAMALPVAWLACALLPGQFLPNPSSSFAVNQVAHISSVLGTNALSIIFGSVICFILARVRGQFTHQRA